jgi:uncharacterized membrane protein
MSSSTAPGETGADAGGRRGPLRIALAIAGVAVLELVAHCAALASVNAGAVLAPLVVPGAIATWAVSRQGWRRGLVVLGAIAGLCIAALSSSTVARLLPLAAQLLVCLAIAWLFGRTLRPPAVPLVTRLARAVHGTLPPPIEAYTRHVTVAWTGFMLLLSAASVLLFACAPFATWSWLANVLLLPLVVLMFLGEYAYRTLRYPWFTHATLLQSVAAFQRMSREHGPR